MQQCLATRLPLSLLDLEGVFDSFNVSCTFHLKPTPLRYALVRTVPDPAFAGE
jgi:hypothetical protein